LAGRQGREAGTGVAGVGVAGVEASAALVEAGRVAYPHPRLIGTTDDRPAAGGTAERGCAEMVVGHLKSRGRV